LVLHSYWRDLALAAESRDIVPVTDIPSGEEQRPGKVRYALASGGNPSVYALIVALSVSNTFLIPGASPTLLIVAGPGGYKPRDFVRVGLPLTVLMLVVTLVMVNVVFNR
jgi:hypothetical protein